MADDEDNKGNNSDNLRDVIYDFVENNPDANWSELLKTLENNPSAARSGAKKAGKAKLATFSRPVLSEQDLINFYSDVEDMPPPPQEEKEKEPEKEKPKEKEPAKPQPENIKNAGRENGFLKFFKKHGKKIAALAVALGVSVAAVKMGVFSLFSKDKGYPDDNQNFIEFALNNGATPEQAVKITLEDSPELSRKEKLALVMANLDMSFEEAQQYLGKLESEQTNTSGSSSSTTTSSAPGSTTAGTSGSDGEQKKSVTFNLTFTASPYASIITVPSEYAGGVIITDQWGYEFTLPWVIMGREGSWNVRDPQTGGRKTIRTFDDIAELYPNGGRVVVNAGDTAKTVTKIGPEDVKER